MFPACCYLCENERYIIYITMSNHQQPAFYNWLLAGSQLNRQASCLCLHVLNPSY